MTKQLQYELWEECNSRCTYCSLGLENRCSSNKHKLESIRTAINELNQTTEEYDVLGFIGGEFFQGQLSTLEIHDEFINLMKIANKKLNDGSVKKVWINATMTIGNQKDLWETIDIFDDLSNVWILTSYDTLGRFHTQKMFETWEQSMKKLFSYNNLNINTTSIITSDFIKRYLNNDIDLNKFKQKYNTSLFLKTTVKPDHLCHYSCKEINDRYLGDFFPTRKLFLEFLMKYKAKEGENEFNKLFSNELKATEVRKNFDNDNFRNVSFIRTNDYKETLNCDHSIKNIETMKCGHSNIYNCYTDCDGCVICDKKMIEDI